MGRQAERIAVTTNQRRLAKALHPILSPWKHAEGDAKAQCHSLILGDPRDNLLR
jgi:hypothetical protein